MDRVDGGEDRGIYIPGGLAVCHWRQRKVGPGEGSGGTAGPQPVGGREIQVHIGFL